MDYNFGEYVRDENGYARRVSGRHLNFDATSSSTESSESEESQVSFSSEDTDEDFEDSTYGSSKKKSNSSRNSKKKRSGGRSEEDGAYEEPETRRRKKKRSDYFSDEYSSSDSWRNEVSDSSDDQSMIFSTRDQKRVSYTEDDESSDSEEEEAPKPEEPKGPRIDHIIGFPDDWNFSGEPSKLFIKEEGESYRHCHWANDEEIMSFTNGKQLKNSCMRKIKRSRRMGYEFEWNEENHMKIIEKENYSDDYKIVHRVIAENDDGQYLVLWKGLDYNDVTWENPEEIDEKEIEAFNRRNNYEIYENLPPPPQPNPENFRSFKEDYELPPAPEGYKLRDYQIEGIDWLRNCWYNNKNCILGDEMGLGKTLQSVNIIYDLARIGDHGPFLIVAPLSTLDQWMREFNLWTDLNVVKYAGEKKTKEIIEKYELYFPGTQIPKFNVILTNPDVLINSENIFRPINWHYVIIDEAHILKNPDSQRYKFIESLQMQHLLLLTGTPIQNNIGELWALLHLIDSKIFDNEAGFVDEFGEPTPENAERIRKILKKYMLRREKSDVEQTLCKKEETIVNVELTTLQKMVYRALIEQKVVDMYQNEENHRRLPEMSNLAMQLRLVCCHPFLIERYEDIIGDILQEKGWSYYQKLINCSGKMVFLEKLLEKLKRTGEKVLIFSQFKKVLNYIEDFLSYKQYKYERLDGDLSQNDRQVKMDKFNDPNEDIFVFMLTTKAGGVGVNLTAANVVVIFDSDWNPQNDIQAMARCHRIGQKADKVVVYRLITRGTYENEMFERASLKQGLNAAILKSDEIKMDKKDLENLLKKGAYYQLKDDNNDECEKFQNQSIEDILDSRTRTFTAATSNTNSSFSTADFAADKKDLDVELDDPNFWGRLCPGAKEKVVAPLAKRTRSRTKLSFSSDDDDDDEMSWNESSLEKCISALAKFGPRLSKIMELTGIPSSKEAQEGYEAVIHRLFEGKPKDLEIVLGKGYPLSPAQEKLMKTKGFKNAIASRKDKDKFISAVKKMYEIDLYINKRVRIGNVRPTQEWDSKNDDNLLKSIWTNGTGNFETILKDKDYFPEGFFTPEMRKVASRREKKLVESIEKCLLEGKTSNGSTRNLEKLAHLLMKIGYVSDSIKEKVSSNTGVPKDKIDSEVKRIFKAAHRLVEHKHLKSEDSDLKSFLKPADAKSIDEMRIWMKDFRHFYKHKFKDNKSLLKSAERKNKEPKFWNFEKMDPAILKYVYTHGFYRLEDLKDKVHHIKPDDMETFKSYSKREDNLKKHINYITDLYKKGPKKDSAEKESKKESDKIKVDKEDQKLSLPAAKGSTTIETLGDGEFFLYKKYLCRVGYHSTYKHKGHVYKCEINKNKKFVVDGKEGSSPEKAFKAAGLPDAGSNKFGISKTFIKYHNQKTLGSQQINGYRPIEFTLN